MGNNVRFNNINYDVEKLMVFKGEGTLAEVGGTEVIDCDTVATVDDPRVKNRVVVPRDGKFVTLLKPANPGKGSEKRVTILSKFVLKKVAAPVFKEAPRQAPFVDQRPVYQSRPDFQPRVYPQQEQGYRERGTFSTPNNGFNNRNTRNSNV